MVVAVVVVVVVMVLVIEEVGRAPPPDRLAQTRWQSRHPLRFHQAQVARPWKGPMVV